MINNIVSRIGDAILDSLTIGASANDISVFHQGFAHIPRIVAISVTESIVHVEHDVTSLLWPLLEEPQKRD